jgi:hypothetical protein
MKYQRPINNLANQDYYSYTIRKNCFTFRYRFKKINLLFTPWKLFTDLQIKLIRIWPVENVMLKNGSLYLEIQLGMFLKLLAICFLTYRSFLMKLCQSRVKQNDLTSIGSKKLLYKQITMFSLRSNWVNKVETKTNFNP